MTIRYDKKKDQIIVIIGRQTDEPYEVEGGDFTAFIDEDDNLVKFTIANGSRFIAQALATGISVENISVTPPKNEMVWYDVDSSMISAFGYNEAEQILEVAFNSTGVYRYFDVPFEIFDGLRNASSKGSYMRDMIIDMYDYEKKRGRSR
jgi:hypothetical protein